MNDNYWTLSHIMYQIILDIIYKHYFDGRINISYIFGAKFYFFQIAALGNSLEWNVIKQIKKTPMAYICSPKNERRSRSWRNSLSSKRYNLKVVRQLCIWINHTLKCQMEAPWLVCLFNRWFSAFCKLTDPLSFLSDLPERRIQAKD